MQGQRPFASQAPKPRLSGEDDVTSGAEAEDRAVKAGVTTEVDAAELQIGGLDFPKGRRAFELDLCKREVRAPDTVEGDIGLEDGALEAEPVLKMCVAEIRLREGGARKIQAGCEVRTAAVEGDLARSRRPLYRSHYLGSDRSPLQVEHFHGCVLPVRHDSLQSS
ncbi:MAG TPA: hypothetical protein VF245_09430 [Solirubrobacterales bacterium]